MKYEYIGGTFAPIIKFSLNKNEKVKVESGSMIFKENVELKGGLNTNKKGFSGIMSAVGRTLSSGESLFISEATGLKDGAILGISPKNIGKIYELTIGDDIQYNLNTGVYLASEMTANYKMVRQKIGNAIFSGSGGLYVMETFGKGKLFIESFGDILELEVTPDTPLIIDNKHVLAWSKDLNYNFTIESGIFGFKTGEGLVNTFTGKGKVLIQTRSFDNLVKAVVSEIPSK